MKQAAFVASVCKMKGSINTTAHSLSRLIGAVIALNYLGAPLWSAEPEVSEAEQWKRITERIRTELGITNAEEMMKIPIFRDVVVHPAFGFRWDEIPPPTLTNAAAMATVNAFIATNGWNMCTGGLGHFAFVSEKKSLRGLPWREIRDRDFDAVTHKEILYVRLKGWHYNDSGVAFNPKTNRFDGSIAGFKHLTNHWYVWAMPEDPDVSLAKIYEGEKVPTQAGPHLSELAAIEIALKTLSTNSTFKVEDTTCDAALKDWGWSVTVWREPRTPSGFWTVEVTHRGKVKAIVSGF